MSATERDKHLGLDGEVWCLPPLLHKHPVSASKVLVNSFHLLPCMNDYAELGRCAKL